MTPKVIFFRGLNTSGLDQAYVGPWNFGYMHRHFEPEFAKRGVELHGIMGMGVGPLTEIAVRAREALLAHPVWQSGEPVHFFGHSAGGLVARLLLKEFANESRILSCLTLATPNQGSGLARHCLEIPEKHRRSTLLMRSIGFDIRRAAGIYQEFTRENIERLFSESAPDPRLASVVCWAPREEWCAPLRLVYSIPAFRAYDAVSDGVVEKDAQPIGEVIAEHRVDHIRQAGFFDDGRRFHPLCDTITDFFKARNG